MTFKRAPKPRLTRDQQCLIDYLQTRSEIDPKRTGVTGMSARSA
jgi:dienelactone hydrolase